MRELPTIDQGLPSPKRPISFVCVRFSNEFDHNIVISECVHDSLNEFIVIDNTNNLHYQTLGQAMNAGIDQAQHDIIVVVHEDVVFLPGWQSLFECSLTALEKQVPDWHVLGVIGWSKGVMLGSCGDPRGVYNPEWQEPYTDVLHIDEQLLVFKKDSVLRPDSDLPTIHHHGRDLIRRAVDLGSKAYVVRAPTVHKYADANGTKIFDVADSDKIRNRNSTMYKLHKACADEYLSNKWPEHFKHFSQDRTLSDEALKYQHKLRNPVILLGDQKNITAAAQYMMKTENIFFDTQTVDIKDKLPNLAGAVCKTIFRKYDCPKPVNQSDINQDLKCAASRLLQEQSWPERWGFAIEESAYAIKELQLCFDNAAFVRIINANQEHTPVYSTDYLGNELGQTLIKASYKNLSIDPQISIEHNEQVKSEKLSEYRSTLISGFISHLKESVMVIDVNHPPALELLAGDQNQLKRTGTD